MTKPTGADLFWALCEYLGTPYEYGGWDCSEAILQACRDLSVPFVDGSGAQKDRTTPTALETAPIGSLGWRSGHDGLLDGAGGLAHAANESRGTVWDDSYAPIGLTYAGLIPGIDYTEVSENMAGSAKAVKNAKAAVGKGSTFSGWCEKFTRTCFGFSAKYASAKLAYQAAKKDGKVTVSYNAPAGVPVFWDITSGTNRPYDHVAVSVGGGYCISTSAGPGRTVAKVKISDLTKRWGMRYLGWADHYHGKRVYTWPKKDSSSPGEPKKARSRTKALQVVRGLGYRTIAEYQRAQQCPVGLVPDDDWGHLTECHYVETYRLQQALGLVDDGDWRSVTTAAVKKAAKKHGKSVQSLTVAGGLSRYIGVTVKGSKPAKTELHNHK